jgi:hypothetical protein
VGLRHGAADCQSANHRSNNKNISREVSGSTFGRLVAKADDEPDLGGLAPVSFDGHAVKKYRERRIFETAVRTRRSDDGGDGLSSPTAGSRLYVTCLPGAGLDVPAPIINSGQERGEAWNTVGWENRD